MGNNVLPVVALDGGVVVLLRQLHAVHQVAHVLAQHLVRHLHLSAKQQIGNGELKLFC